MNLYIRLMIAILRGFWKSKMAVSDTLHRSMRVLPNDIDINMHLNNGRYMTILDLLTVELCLRTNILMPVFKMGWRPMLGGTIIVYKKQLSLFEKYTVDLKIKCWDDTWTYFEFEFMNTAGKSVAFGYSKGAWVSGRGFIKNEIVEKKLNMQRSNTPFPEDLRKWIDAEASLLKTKSPPDKILSLQK